MGCFNLTAAVQTDGQAGWQSDRQHKTRNKKDRKQTDRLTQAEGKNQERERETKGRHTERQIKGFSH